MTSFSNFSLFCFDLDGLLINSEKLHYQAYKELVESLGTVFPWDFSTYCQIAHSHEPQRLQKHLLELVPSLPWKDLKQEKTARLLALLEERVELMPGVEPLLQELLKNNIEVCVVTNSSRGLVEKLLPQHPILQKIPLWLTREDYAHPKPAPDGYLLALERCGVEHSKAIGFEDTSKGIHALARAGIQPVWISPYITSADRSDEPIMGAIPPRTLAEVPFFSSLNDFLAHQRL